MVAPAPPPVNPAPQPPPDAARPARRPRSRLLPALALVTLLYLLIDSAAFQLFLALSGPP